jgi:autotransporter-associated beta strand protein
VDFTSTSAAVEYQTNPPALSNGIIGGYAFTSNAGFTTVDFATLTSTTPYTIQPYASYTTGNLGALASTSSANVAPSGTQTTVSSSKTFNSLKLTGSLGVTIGSGDSLGFNSGGIIANTSGTISGGTLSAPNGEMIINAVQHLTVSSVIDADVALVKTGSATLTLTSTTPLNGDTYLNQGTLEYAPASDLEYDGAMYGAGNLLKSGSAMMTLGGVSSYTGSTSVTGGTLCVNGSLGAGTTVSLQGAVLTGYGTVGGSVNVTSSGGTIAMSSAGAITGQVTDSSGVLTVGQTGGSNYLSTTGGVNISGTGTLVANSTAAIISGSLRYTSSANSSFTGVISGASTLTLNSTSGTTLTLSGADTFSGGANIQSGTLVKQGTSTLAITGAPTLGSAGVLTVSAGTLEFNVTSGTASIQSGFTATVAAAATLQLAGTVSALSDGSALNPSDGQLVNVTNNGATASGGGFLVTGTNQSVGVVAGDATTSGGATTYGGDTVVGDGTNAADLTVTQILQNTLTINAGSTVTIRPSGSGISGDAIVSAIAGPGVASASPAVALNNDIDSIGDPFLAIQAAIESGSISSAAGQQLENRVAAIERLAATDPGLDVSLLENRVLASLGSLSLLSASPGSQPTETGSGLLAIDSTTFASDSKTDGAATAFSPASGFGDGSELGSGGAPVPEPGTLVLVCIAAIGLGLFQVQTRIGR